MVKASKRWRGCRTNVRSRENAHINIGKIAGDTFDVIIFSGKFNQYYFKGIENSKINKDKVFFAENALKVIEILNNSLNKIFSEGDLTQDLILIKGSQSARLEKVVVDLLQNPHDRNEVCRQEEEWQNR